MVNINDKHPYINPARGLDIDVKAYDQNFAKKLSILRYLVPLYRSNHPRGAQFLILQKQKHHNALIHSTQRTIGLNKAAMAFPTTVTQPQTSTHSASQPSSTLSRIQTIKETKSRFAS